MKIIDLVASTEKQLQEKITPTDRCVHIEEKEFSNLQCNVQYQIYPSPYGDAIVLVFDKRLFGMQFIENSLEDSLLSITKKYSNIHLARSNCVDPFWHDYIYKKPLSFVLPGSFFYFQVWKFLTSIPEGGLVSYDYVAKAIGRPSSVRAVATAIGKNPVAMAIPCHRVIRKNGQLGGYRYGLERKKKLLQLEISSMLESSLI